MLRLPHSRPTLTTPITTTSRLLDAITSAAVSTIEDVEFSLDEGDSLGSLRNPYFTDASAVALVYQDFELVEHLHKARIISQT